MSKFGRFTLLSLLLALMLVLVACGGGAQEAAPTDANSKLRMLPARRMESWNKAVIIYPPK